MDLNCPVCGQLQPSLAVLNAHLDLDHFAPPATSKVVASWLNKAKDGIKDGLKELKMARVGSGGSSPVLLGQDTAISRPGTRQPSLSASLSVPNIPLPAAPSPSPSRSPTLQPPAPAPAPAPTPPISRPPFQQPPFRPPDPVSHTDVFRALRATHPKRESSDREALEVNKLESRYQRLVSIHMDGKRVREREKEVVPWIDDKRAISCAVCGQFFSLTNRRHHCRLGGECICNKPTCSITLPLLGDFAHGDLERERIGETRACARCAELVYRLRKPVSRVEGDPLVELYREMTELRKAGEAKLAEFNESMVKLARKAIDEADPEFVKAQGLRKEITSAFAEFDRLSKRIAGLPGQGQRKRLHANIRAAAVAFLQNNLFTLQLLPAPKSANSPGIAQLPTGPTQTLASLSRISDLNSLYAALASQKEALEAQIKASENSRGSKEDREVLLGAWGEVGGEMARVERELAGLVV